MTAPNATENVVISIEARIKTKRHREILAELRARYDVHEKAIAANPWPHIQKLNDKIIRQALILAALKHAAWPSLGLYAPGHSVPACQTISTVVVPKEDYECLLALRGLLDSLEGTDS